MKVKFLKEKSCRQEKLLFSTANKVKEIDTDTGIVEDLATHTSIVYSIVYDVKERYVYIPRLHENIIVRFPYPNNKTISFEIVVLTTGPFSVAFDSENSHLFWTETGLSGKIMRCNSDGSDVIPIVNVTSPMALTLDTHNRWIYYSKAAGHALHRVTFDGKENHVVINLTSRLVDILVDFVSKRLIWMEYDTGDLKSASYNGSDVKTVRSTNVTSSNREIDIRGDYVFYTSTNKILKVHKSSGQIPAIVHTDTTQIYGLLFYKQDGLEEKLLFSTHGYVKEIDLKSGAVKVLLNVAGNFMFALAYDYDERYLYIPIRSGDIVKFPYPNNQTVQFEIVVSTNPIIGIAFDSVNKHIYWTEDEKGKIMRCNKDGTNKTTIFEETQPGGLSIDIENRWIYYGQDLINGKIYRLTFDGKDKRVIYNPSSHVFGIQV
ncbi:Hypothetical predicted protein, partial [Mytilus galloprovincialis]